jgi:CRISPR-associated endoribonuclease Cas6
MNKISQYINFPLLSARVKARATSDIIWNSFPGSVIHGIIGFELKNISCVMSHRTCEDCFLVHSCPYGIIYESPLPPNTERMRLYPQAPHPIRIVIHPWNKTALVKGQEFEIMITLVGKATTFCLIILLGLEKGFREGIGRKIDGQRGTAEILTVTDLFTQNTKDWGQLKENYLNFLTGMTFSNRPLSDSNDLVIEFRSPTKIITDSKPNYSPTVRDIISTLLRRIGNLSYFYGGISPELDFEGLLSTASALKYESEYKQIPAHRYSSRQKRAIDIEGIVGKIIVRDCPSEIAKILKAGEYFGIGKGTTMGFGDYQVR